MNSSLSNFEMGFFFGNLILSIDAIGETSAAVPVKKASSAPFKSDGFILFSITVNPRSFASVITASLVIPGRIEPVRGV